jgi:hypothetical protein
MLEFRGNPIIRSKTLQGADIVERYWTKVMGKT